MRRERTPREQAAVRLVEEAFASYVEGYPVLFDIEVLTMDPDLSRVFGYIKFEEPEFMRVWYIISNTKPRFLVFQDGNQYYAASKPIIMEALDKYFLQTYKQAFLEEDDETLTKIAAIIPKRIKKKIKKQSVRKQLPANYFLLPKERKFPYRDPDTGKIHCGLLRAAITRAAQHGYKQVESKARKLYQRHCKNRKSSAEETLEIKLAHAEFDGSPALSETAHAMSVFYGDILAKVASQIDDFRIPDRFYLDEKDRLYIYRNPVTGEVDPVLLKIAVERARDDKNVEAFHKGFNLYRKYASLSTVLKWGLIGALTAGGSYLGHNILKEKSEWYRKNVAPHIEDAFHNISKMTKNVTKGIKGTLDKISGAFKKKKEKKNEEDEKYSEYATN